MLLLPFGPRLSLIRLVAESASHQPAHLSLSLECSAAHAEGLQKLSENDPPRRVPTQSAPEVQIAFGIFGFPKRARVALRGMRT